MAHKLVQTNQVVKTSGGTDARGPSSGGPAGPPRTGVRAGSGAHEGARVRVMRPGPGDRDGTDFRIASGKRSLSALTCGDEMP
ncbi:hypothetical protein B9S64_21215 [Streptomyces sp. SM18]|nr:hypothetical protein B9S64_21215 [Streptomyces sp. SM18]